MNYSDIKVLVLCGGTSTEREVSLRSGAAVYTSLVEAGFDAEILDIRPENASEILRIKPDVAYIALHGKGGEDGSIQGMLEWLGIPYTGPGIASSAVCIDKVLAKDILSSSGVRTPKYTVIRQGDNSSFDSEKIISEFGLPVVVKAACQGSSIGVEIVNEAERLSAAVTEIKKYGNDILIEQFITGKELTVPIIGNSVTETLPVIEITSENEFYDYESKYTAGMSHHIIPARISDEAAEEVKREAEKAFLACGCRGISRVDVMLGEDNIPYVIEINTAPGMTETSLVPDAARHVGMSFPELSTRIVLLALEDSQK